MNFRRKLDLQNALDEILLSNSSRFIPFQKLYILQENQSVTTSLNSGVAYFHYSLLPTALMALVGEK